MQMLLRPPFVKQQDLVSQSSNARSLTQRQQSAKSYSKNKIKQNSLATINKTNKIVARNDSQSANNWPNQDADNASMHSINSKKSKPKTKQSTLAISKNKNCQNNNQQIGYSSKNQNDSHDYETFKLDSEDDKSIGSHASKNSKKNCVKQNSLSKNRNAKVNVQITCRNSKQSNRASPSKFYIEEEEESKVQTVRLKQNLESFEPLKYNESLKECNYTLKEMPYTKTQPARQNEPEKSRQRLSSFQQINIQRERSRGPVYKIQDQSPSKDFFRTEAADIFSQRNQNKPNQYEISQHTQNNVSIPKKQQGQSSNQVKAVRVDLRQSNSIQPQMISTKSVTKSVRKNKIFDNDYNTINSSKINSSRTNLSGSFEKSRSKSKTKLGQLLKQSKLKKEFQKSQQKPFAHQPPTPINSIKPTSIQNQTNFFADINHRDQSRQPEPPNLGYQGNLLNIEKSHNLASINALNRKPLVGAGDGVAEKGAGGSKLGNIPGKIEQIQPKKMQNQIFNLGESQESQLDLNLSASYQKPEVCEIRGDSLHFNLEPSKKKGLSISSKIKNLTTQNKCLQSKNQIDRLMKKCQQNDQFLAKSILSSNSDLRTSQRQILMKAPASQLNKQGQTFDRPFQQIKQGKLPENSTWKQVPKNGPFQIKTVERKQIRKPVHQYTKIEEKSGIQKVWSIHQQQIEAAKGKPSLTQQIPTAKGPQILLKSPFCIPKQDPFFQSPITEQQRNLHEQIAARNIEQQQKNRFLFNIQQKAKTQKQQSYIQTANQFITHHKDQIKQNHQKQSHFQNSSQMLSSIQNLRDQTFSINELSHSQNQSDRSHSHSKNKKKKQTSLNIMKRHKVIVRDQSPRAQQSFYKDQTKESQIVLKQQSKYQPHTQPQRSPKIELSKKKLDSKKPNLISFGQRDFEEEKIKSKTDVNFFKYEEMLQKSQTPSSKPPLSRKSGCSSKSKSKAKQTTLKANMNRKQNKIEKNSKNQQDPKKKKTLIELAQDKEYEGSSYGGTDSQCSFNSRQSFTSTTSKKSKQSACSKKQTTLPIKLNQIPSTPNSFRPSLNKIHSMTSQIEINRQDQKSIYSQLKEKSVKISRQKSYQEQPQERTIISKDTYFIDERGRLVRKDLIIQGNKVYGRNINKKAEQMAIQRMKRSRQHHRSRSKSRDESRSKKRNSTSFGDCFNIPTSSNFSYDNDSNFGSQCSIQKTNLYIEQFIKPIEEPALTHQNHKFQKKSIHQRQIEREFYQNEDLYQNQYQDEKIDEEPVRNITLNQLFGQNKKYQTKTNAGPNQTHMKNAEHFIYGANRQEPRQTNYGASSKYGQQSKQLSRKKNLSRTEKTFYNR